MGNKKNHTELELSPTSFLHKPLFICYVYIYIERERERERGNIYSKYLPILGLFQGLPSIYNILNTNVLFYVCSQQGDINFTFYYVWHSCTHGSNGVFSSFPPDHPVMLCCHPVILRWLMECTWNRVCQFSDDCCLPATLRLLSLFLNDPEAVGIARRQLTALTKLVFFFVCIRVGKLCITFTLLLWLCITFTVTVLGLGNTVLVAALSIPR